MVTTQRKPVIANLLVNCVSATFIGVFDKSLNSLFDCLEPKSADLSWRWIFSKGALQASPACLSLLGLTIDTELKPWVLPPKIPLINKRKIDRFMCTYLEQLHYSSLLTSLVFYTAFSFFQYWLSSPGSSLSSFVNFYDCYSNYI